MVTGVIKKSGSYTACLECRRVFKQTELKEQKKKSDEENIKCPFCGSTRFTSRFTNVVLCLDPEKSAISDKIEPKITSPGIYAFFLE